MKTLLALTLFAASASLAFAQDNPPAVQVLCTPGTPLCAPVVDIQPQRVIVPTDECKKTDTAEVIPPVEFRSENEATINTPVYDEAGGIIQPCHA
jgi:hypothetical protein